MTQPSQLPPITDVCKAAKKKKTPRCCAPECNKKIGLLSFQCKCGLSFCVKHKLPELHNCTFNHKSEGILSLKQKLVKVATNKIIPI